MLSCPLPVRQKLRLMPPGPLNHETPRSWRQPAGNDCGALDTHGGLSLSIASMKMRSATMVDLVVVHPDRDSVEAAYSGHPATLGLLV